MCGEKEVMMKGRRDLVLEGRGEGSAQRAKMKQLNRGPG